MAQNSARARRSCCSSTPTTSTSTARTASASRSSTRSIELIGPDDLVGVMTPEMSASDITFARKTTTIDGFLTRYWHWGERDRLNPADPEDEQYGDVLSRTSADRRPSAHDQNGIAAEMIDRRHEKLTLDALRGSGRLPARRARGAQGDARDHRRLAAVSARTTTWRGRCSARACRPARTVGVDPRIGQADDQGSGERPRHRRTSATSIACSWRRSTTTGSSASMLDEANRANASFYPIDPRGLAVFDTPMMRQDVAGAAAADRARHRSISAMLRGAHRLAAHARRSDRRPRDRQLEQSRRRPASASSTT